MEPATLESANAIPLLRTLDIRLTEIGDRHAVMEVAVNEKHGNYFGGVHGGLIATLVDTVCFFPRPLLPSGLLTTTSSLIVSFIRPARIGDRLTARSELLHLGRRTASLTVQVLDGEGRLVAHGSATLMIIQETAPQPSCCGGAVTGYTD
jgi:acyl-CoA thioesterase